jgi:WhiB family transcriptional regulator, redox-sensing transcriptional regulator
MVRGGSALLKGGELVSNELDSKKATSLKLGTSWMELARCRDVDAEVFFPSDGPGVQAAQRYCSECLVRESCLEYALENNIQHGVWGGASERARRRIAHQRRLAMARTAAKRSTAWDEHGQARKHGT